LLNAKELIESQTSRTEFPDIFNSIVFKNYLFNSVLWHFEDKARDTNSKDDEIANVKRAIDYLNQERNNSIEEINNYMLQELSSEMNVNGLLISETPGSLIDRLSILHLKKYSLENYLNFNPEDEDGRLKHQRVNSQIADLLLSMENIVTQIGLGNWYFKLYFNNKLYNNPKYNKNIIPNDEELLI